MADDERREVAQRLRNMSYDDTKESLICAYLDALGVEGEWLTWVEIAHRLADLIEPSCDCDALLVLADEMTVEKGDIWGWSSRIREALGV